MSNTKDFIVEQLKNQISDLKDTTEEKSFGRVVKVGDGIARVSGLSEVMMSEMLEFKTVEGSVYGVALNLEEDSVSAIILGEYSSIKEGDEVISQKRILEVPVGNDVIGRVVDPLGKALDGKEDIKSNTYYPIEKVAPGVITRQSVNQPLQTGIKAIDSMVPIGKGQRELIIGDRQIGKTAVAIDTIINQKGKNVKCIYVAIGQKESKVASIVAKLEEYGAMEYTSIVLAGASDPASLLYISPYTGCAMAEYFLDKGEDVLIVYDDLSKHAVAYREVSLLLRRPPGREAYPGDVFYLHSRLLERACRLNKEHGGGSITALPIIETQTGDVSAYIPTNVISITDGQIYLDPDMFNKGNRPAVDAGISVSRVGSSAQTKAIKKVASKVKLEIAQYKELAAFAQFSSDLDKDTKAKLNRGERLVELFKQKQYDSMSVAKQTYIFFSAINGFMDNVPVERITEFESSMLEYLDDRIADVAEEINKTGDMSEENKEKIIKSIEGFKDTVDYLIQE
jgi:F-type H+/Na+-transporting ATPase subunit alpha